MKRVSPIYETQRGAMFVGPAEQVLTARPLTDALGKVQLIFTSPPFPMPTKKRYGGLEGEAYLSWLTSFAETFDRYLKPDGSIVMEIGNAWESGRPTMSTLPIRTLLAFLDAGRFHLCEEFVCYNTARIPAPAQWVTVERIRVKDAFTHVWWMSPTDRPKADNRRVPTAYSESMRKLLVKGTYNPGARPSGYTVGENSFLRDNGGAIPPNVLVPAGSSNDTLNLLPLANTESRSAYLRYCRQQGIVPHPARMPERLAEFFIRFLTEPGDLVLDPFAGTNTTGAVAEKLEREWLCIEAERSYAAASRVRFCDAAPHDGRTTASNDDPVVPELDLKKRRH